MSSPLVAEILDKEWKPASVWLARHEVFREQARQGAIPLLFLGDSITEAWLSAGKKPWDAGFAPLGAVNFGIGGDEVQHVLWRVQNGEVDGLTPTLIVLLVATNNIGNAGHSGAETAKGVDVLVDTLREKLPETHILLHKVFPRDANPGSHFRREIVILNEGIAGLAKRRRVTIFDVNHLFLDDDGTIATETMPDFLHLSSKSYQRWAELLIPEVRRLMGL